MDAPNGVCDLFDDGRVFVFMTFEDIPNVTELLLGGCEGIFCGAFPVPKGFGTVITSVTAAV